MKSGSLGMGSSVSIFHTSHVIPSGQSRWKTASLKLGKGQNQVSEEACLASKHSLFPFHLQRRPAPGSQGFGSLACSKSRMENSTCPRAGAQSRSGDRHPLESLPHRLPIAPRNLSAFLGLWDLLPTPYFLGA